MRNQPSKHLSTELVSLIESWKEAGDQTDYGKKKDLPKIDYWRRVGGQNVGFVGKDGEGVPVTGFSGNRAVLMGDDPDAAYASNDVAYAPSELASKYLKKAIADSGGRKKPFKLTGEMVIDRAMSGLAYGMENQAMPEKDYKSARKKGAKKFEAALEKALKKVGMSREKFDVLSDADRRGWGGEHRGHTPFDSQLLIPVFDEIQKSILEENKKKVKAVDDKQKNGQFMAQLSNGCRVNFSKVGDEVFLSQERKEKLIKNTNEMMLLYANVFPEKMQMDVKVEKNVRAYCGLYSIVCDTKDFSEMVDGTEEGLRVFSHELTHWADNHRSDMLPAAIRFLGERNNYKKTKSEVGFEFDNVPKIRGEYKVDGETVYEVAFDDDFTENYVGKIYTKREYEGFEEPEIYASEVNTMAAQQFRSARAMIALYRDDKDLFEHGYALMTGQFNYNRPVDDGIWRPQPFRGKSE